MTNNINSNSSLLYPYEGGISTHSKKSKTDEKRNPFEEMPYDVYVLIFCLLSPPDWRVISLTDRSFRKLSLDQQVVNSFLEKASRIPVDKYLMFAGLAGSHLKTFDCRKLKYEERVCDLHLEQLAKTCSKIQNIHLVSAKVTHEGLKHLKNLTSLRSLELNSCETLIQEELEEPLNSLTFLQSLCIGGFSSIDNHFEYLRTLTFLQSLKLCHCQDMTNANLECLEALTFLKSLSLDGNIGINDHDLKYLAALTNLQFLKLYPSIIELTQDGLKSLEAMSALRTLDLFADVEININEEDLGHFTALSLLQFLNLDGYNDMTDNGFKRLSALTSLQFLGVGGSKITDNGLKYLTAMTNLQSLDLSHCYSITEKGFRYFTSLSALRTLKLNNCDGITDVALEHLTALSSLQDLELDECCNITDIGLLQLKALPSLRYLQFTLRWHSNILRDIGFEKHPMPNGYGYRFTKI